MTEILLHRVCDYCLDGGNLTPGFINVFDFNYNRLRRSCESHFESHKKEFHKDKGNISFGFFTDRDYKDSWGTFYVRPEYDTNTRTAKQDKVGQKLGPR